MISYRLSVTRGAQAVYPAFTARCPGRRLLQTFAVTGPVSPQIVGPNPFVRRRAFDYAGKREWGIIVDFNTHASKPGDTLTGTIYAVCR